MIVDLNGPRRLKIGALVLKKQKNFFGCLVYALKHVWRLDSDQYGLVSLVPQARTQPPNSAFFH